MKKLLFAILIIALGSCSFEQDPPIKKPEEKTVLVIESQRKSAIANFKKSTTTSKTSVERKKLIKSITYTSGNVNDQKYKINMTIDEYLNLPTDNVYDIKEDSLNRLSKKYDERTYTYNTEGNLEKITIDNIAYPNNNGTEAYKPIVFEYESSGEKKQITRYQSNGMVMIFQYNTIGQIDKAFDIYGKLIYTYSYDESGNIASKYFFINDSANMHYTYMYYPDNTYEKNWLVVNPDGTERLTSTVKYSYNRNVEGVYQNEPLYRATLDNQEGLQYLHILSNSAGYNPKYFYDSDGYLIKYDKGGQNNINDITIFIYE